MNRRQLIHCAPGAMVLACAPAIAAHGSAHVGALLWNPEPKEPRFQTYFAGLMEALGRRGARRIEWEWRFAARKTDRLAAQGVELAAKGLDALVGFGSLSVRALANATRNVPIVGTVGNPFKEGYTPAINRPIANVTGVSDAYPDVALKMMEHLKAVMPTLARFGIVAPAGLSITAEFVDYHEEATRKVGVEPVTHLVKSGEEAIAAFRSMPRAGITAGFVPFSAGFFPDRRSIASLALECRVAVVDLYEPLAQAGGLLTFSADFDMDRALAEQLDRILGGTPVSEMPFRMPTRFRLTINRKTANALGLSIPPHMLLSADKVIE